MKIIGESKLALVIIGVLAIALTGCGSNSNQKEVEPTIVPTEAPTEPIAEPEVAQEGLKDTEELTEEALISQTPLEDIGGEGMTDRIVPNLDGVEEAPIGEPVMFANKAGADLCLFAIESVVGSDMAIENMGDVTDKKVVVASYSYTNMSSEDNILFDDMSFKLLVDDTVCTPYFSPQLSPAAPSGVGETAFGQVAFLAPIDCQDAILVFDNASVDAKAMFKITIE